VPAFDQLLNEEKKSSPAGRSIECPEKERITAFSTRDAAAPGLIGLRHAQKKSFSQHNPTFEELRGGNDGIISSPRPGGWFISI